MFFEYRADETIICKGCSYKCVISALGTVTDTEMYDTVINGEIKPRNRSYTKKSALYMGTKLAQLCNRFGR